MTNSAETGTALRSGDAQLHLEASPSATATGPAPFGHRDAPTFLDFFAGAGLVRLGLEPRWSCTWANDIDPRKQEVYEARFGEAEFILNDIANLEADVLPRGADMAWASFPCQDLSLAGDRRGLDAARSGTFWEFWRLMKEARDRGHMPPVIVIENVVGLLYGRNLPALDLQFGPLVLDARLFLPQSRPRVFLVAVDARVRCDPYRHAARPDTAPWFPAAVRAAHAKAPASLKDRWRWWRLPTPVASVPAVETLMESTPSGVAWHKPAETARLLDMMTDANRAKIECARRQGRAVGFLYKRTRAGAQRAEVRFDGIEGSLRTPQGGSSRQTVVVVNRNRVRSRLLSSREAARLMGVPDCFWLPSRYNDAYRAMGDGVAVPVVRWLSEQLLIPLVQLYRQAPDALRDPGRETDVLNGTGAGS